MLLHDNHFLILLPGTRTRTVVIGLMVRYGCGGHKYFDLEHLLVDGFKFKKAAMG